MKIKLSTFKQLFLLLFLVGTNLCQAQHDTQKNLALGFLQTQFEALQLEASDVRNIKITDAYQTKHNGLTHVWFVQTHHDIPVYNGLMGLHVTKDGKVLHNTHRFVAGLERKVNTNLPSLSAFQGLERALVAINLKNQTLPSLRDKINEKEWVFEGGSIARTTIPVRATYQKMQDGTCRLAWLVVIDQLTTNDIWFIRVDAQTGDIIGKSNTTAYCEPTPNRKVKTAVPVDIACDEPLSQAAMPLKPTVQGDGSSYFVVALPNESPSHGPHSLVVDPANAVASPYGWHDTNGMPGGEHAHTRGNNVHAYEDSDANNLPPASLTPSGGTVGTPLVFNAPFDGNLEPNANLDASVTNLFYMNNMMHDIFYTYGFDEPAGNFQGNTYGNAGLGNDAVLAEALDGSGTDNANFATPVDGSAPRMQMFRWTRQAGKVITVNAPGAIAGSYDAAITGWGAPITSLLVTGDGLVVDDGSPNPNLGCNSGSTQDLTGKIALIDRGECQFSDKAFNAQSRGAIGCIICNFDDEPPPLGAGALAGDVTIPVTGLGKTTCDLLRAYAGLNLNISIGLPISNLGPDEYDCDFDNGIIAHEYFHGVSNRLTGGPANSTCLDNDEQMGEGWSDWATLVTATKPGSTGAQRRGVGTFVERQAPTGQGIRRYPYSTDMTTNPLTFGSVAENTEVHALGEVWTAVVWDMYWAFVDKYGFDADWTNTTSGNGRAMQLVVDGMKLQPCNPGFIDGRDAILQADIINNNGADTCLIQTVFARRGFGYQASQGSADIAGDGIESFDPRPLCVKELKVTKSITETITPGGTATVKIVVTNHKETPVTNVVVTDEIGLGMSFVAGSSVGATVNGNQITWNLGTMPFGRVDTITYQIKNNPTYRSALLYAEPMDNEVNWLSLGIAGDQIFFVSQTADKVTGTGAFYASTPATQNNGVLESLEQFTVTGARPALRFWQKFNTEGGIDGGWVEVSTNGFNWSRLKAATSIRNGYTGSISYQTIAIPYLDGFSGNSNGWKQTYLDLKSYAGQTIYVRYRMATDANTTIDGWYLDQTELVDLVNYNEEVKVTSAEGDLINTKAKNAGLIIDTDGMIPTQNVDDAMEVSVYPNPASDLLLVAFGKSMSGQTQATIIAVDGRTVMTRTYQNLQEGQISQFDVMHLTPGVYFLQLTNGAETSTRKIEIAY
jgi:extracellular elastinolytic metalloproteinase